MAEIQVLAEHADGEVKKAGLKEQDGKITAEQSAFGGATNVQSKVTTGTPIIAVRPSSAAPEPAPSAADAGLQAVGDLFEVVPRLLEEIGKRKG